MEMIPENQSSGIGASPLSDQMKNAIVGVDLDMSGKKQQRASQLGERLLVGKPYGDGKSPELDLNYGGPPGPNLSDWEKIEPEQEAKSDLDYGEALKCLKRGDAMARTDWNGKGMFVYHVPAASYPAQTGVAKRFFGPSSHVPYNEYLAIKNANGTVSTWVASINDQLANDWYVVDIDALKHL